MISGLACVTILRFPKRRCKHASLVAIFGIADCNLQLHFLRSDRGPEIPGSKVSFTSRLPTFARSAGHAQGAGRNMSRPDFDAACRVATVQRNCAPCHLGWVTARFE